MFNLLRKCVRGALVAVACVASLTPVFAQSGAGSVSGKVVDAVNNTALVGADVLLDGTAFRAATNRSGEFTLVGVPAGKYSMLVLYLGHTEQRTDVTVMSGQRVTVDVKLAPATFSDSVQVRADAGDGQARALNQQKTALNITNVISADQIGAFPDPNAAEAASRIPGVSIARDQGEGRYILIRGTEPRLNSVMIDGERIPAPEGDTRQVQLDAVPADQLQSIEVSKAVTPDMDADSIGGAVNLVTKQATNRRTLLFSAAGGYNKLQSSGDQKQFSGTVGTRFANGRAGILVAGSSSQLTRGSENFEAQYSSGALSDLQLRDYQIERNRYGLNVALDGKLGTNSLFSLKSIVNRFEDYEVNNRERYRPSNRRIEHVLKNRHQNDDIRSVSLGGQQVLSGSGALLDFKGSYAFSREDQPDRLDTILRQTNINFTPNVSATSIDPNNIQPNPSSDDPTRATLNSWATEIFNTTDRDVTGQVNLRLPFSIGGSTAQLKVGAKIRDKHKQRAFLAQTASPASSTPFSAVRDLSYDNSGFLSYFPATYTKFPGIDPTLSRNLFNALPASRVVEDREGDAQDYSADERVLAGYLMAEFSSNPRLSILPGVRIESTKVDYTGYTVFYDDNGNYKSTTPVTGGATSTFALPGLHVRYAVTPQANLRLAYTRTLARPNYYDLVPYQLVFQEDGDIERGNSSLKPTVSDNIDVLAEHYFESVGMISGGFFYKRLNDYIYPFRFQQTNFGELYNVTQPQNGDQATLWGAEIAFQNRFRALPAPFDGLVLMANYTWTDSSARLPGRSTDNTLPGQSAHLGNLSIGYEKFGFAGKASWNFHGKYIDAVGATAADDVYYDNHTQFDVNLSQRLTKNLRVFADFLNLTNAPLRYYQGVTSRPIQQEYYRWWATFGLKASF